MSLNEIESRLAIIIASAESIKLLLLPIFSSLSPGFLTEHEKAEWRKALFLSLEVHLARATSECRQLVELPLLKGVK